MIRLLLRRHRTALVCWTLGLLALVAVTVPSYEATYGDAQARAVLVAQLQDTAALTLLYGPLPDPGTLGQLFAWETGTYVILLAGVMAVLLGVALTRGEEDAGATELVRSVGVAPRTPLLAALAVLSLACLLVAGGTAAILGAQSLTTEELTLTGSLGYTAVLLLSSLTVGMLAVVAAQLREDRRPARGLALMALALLLVVRIVADETGATWLRWLTPFGWRDLVAPWTEDRLWTLAPMALVVLALAGAAVLLGTRRELGSAWLAASGRSDRRLPVGRLLGPTLGWAWREARSSVVGWSVAVLGTAALFGSMTGGLVATLERDRTTAELLARMGGEVDDPVGMFFSFLGVFVMLLVLVCGVALTLRWRGEEASGRLVGELASGVPRRRSLLARALVAGAVVSALTVGSGLLMGLVGRAQLTEVDPLPQALAATLGDLPGLLAAVGLAALLSAVAPRWVGVVWAAVVASGFLVLFGGLVDVPRRVVDLALLGQGPSTPLHGAPDWTAWLTGPALVLGLVAAATLALAGLLVGRRDLRLG